MGLLPFRIGGHRGRLTSYRYEIQKVKEQLLLPSDEYIQKSMFQEPVMRHLARFFYRTAVYMVVGIKIGIGGRIIHQEQQTLGSHISGTIPGATLGIPVDISADIGVGSMDFNYQEKRIPHSFVFAYRLRKIRYFKKTRIEHSVFTRGAELHCLNNHRQARSQEDRPDVNNCKDYEIFVKGIADEDFGDDDDDEIKVVDECYLVGHSDIDTLARM